ncbi:MAG: crossover junction endodeoxyribonuclease RuvC [Desulfurella sp.]
MGIDPGSRTTAFGIVDCLKKTFIYDFIELNKISDFDNKLCLVFKKTQEILKNYEITEAAVEDVFYSVNIKSSLKLSEIKGAILAAIKIANINVVHYSTREVKQAISGYGAASKNQLKFIIEKTFNTKLDKLPLDVSDAISIALAHCSYKHTASRIN